MHDDRDGVQEDGHLDRETSGDDELSKEPRLFRSAGAIGIVTLLSRITGLLRAQCQAFFLGTSAMADAFWVAFMIPNLFRRFVGEGAMSTGFVPILTRYLRKGDREGFLALVEKFYTLWTVVLLVVTVVGMLLAGVVLGLCQSSWGAEKIDLAVLLTRWLFPYLFLVSLSAVGQAVLNASGVFAFPASVSMFFNLAVISLAYSLQFVFPDEDPVWFLVAGILIGGVLQCLVLVPSLWKRGVRFRPRLPVGHEGLSESLSLLLTGTFGAGIFQINTLVSTVIAMSLALDGAISSLRYSALLMEFVLGIFVFGLSTVGLTALSRHVAVDDEVAVRDTTSKVLRFTIFLTVPSTVGLELVARPVIELTLGFGAFDSGSVDLTLHALRFHALGLVFVGVSRAMTSVFYAYKEVGLVVRAAAVNFVVNVILCYVLSRTFLLHGGIALASSIAALAQAAVLTVVLQRRKGILVPREIFHSTLRAVLASGVMAAVCYGLLRFVEAAEGRWMLALWTGVTIAVGAAVYFVSSWLLGSQEMKLLLRRRSG